MDKGQNIVCMSRNGHWFYFTWDADLACRMLWHAYLMTVDQRAFLMQSVSIDSERKSRQCLKMACVRAYVGMSLVRQTATPISQTLCHILGARREKSYHSHVLKFVDRNVGRNLL